MSTDVQVGLIGFIYCIAMLALEVWAGLFKRLDKYLLQLGQSLPPARDALQMTLSINALAVPQAAVTSSHLRSPSLRGTGRLWSIQGLPSAMPYDTPHGIDFSFLSSHLHAVDLAWLRCKSARTGNST